MPKGIYKYKLTPKRLEVLKRMSQNNRGRKHPHSKETKKKIGDIQRGKKKSPRSEKHKRKISENQKRNYKEGKLKIGGTGDKHFNWKGGLTPLRNKIRNSPEYKLWRWAVFTRDNFTCVWCLKKEEVSGKLEADHIQLFADYPELRFAIDNGRTLCKECHKKRHSKSLEERLPKKNN